MPIFQTLADYEKWRRQQLRQRLANESIAKIAAETARPDIRFGKASVEAGDVNNSPTGKLTGKLKKGSEGTGEFGGDGGTSGGGKGGGGKKGRGPQYNGPRMMNIGLNADGFRLDKTDYGSQPGMANLSLTRQKYTFTCWIGAYDEGSWTNTYLLDSKNINAGSNQTQLQIGPSSAGRWRVSISQQNSINASILSHAGAASGYRGQLAHLMITADMTLSTAEFKYWIDGTLAWSSSGDLAVGAEAAGNEREWYVISANGSTPGNASTSCRVNVGEYAFFDGITVTDPVGVFLDANGAAIDPGTDGTGWGLGQPVIGFFTQEQWNTGVQGGNGGSFTKAGSFTVVDRTADYEGLVAGDTLPA